MNHHAICIAGAHRSGTSMLTRLLHEAGLYLGRDEDLMAPAADNPDGFWENLRFVKINDEILNALGGGWDLPPRPEEKFTSGSLSAVRQKAQLLIESFEGKSPWGWKDPRTCLTMPFWQSLLPDLRTVIIVRNPLETAYSMHKRNGTSYAFGLRLWEVYNRQLIEHVGPGSRIVAHYESFFENPEAQLRRIARFAGLPDDKIETAARLIARDRRHTSFTTEQLIDAGASEPIVTLYRSLLEEAAQEETDRRSSMGNSPAQRVTKARDIAGRAQLDELAGAVNRLNISVPDNETVRQELASRRGEVAMLEARTQELIEARQVAREEIAKRDGRIAEMEATVVRIDHMFQREQAALRQTWQRIAEMEAALGESRQRISESQQLAEQRQSELSEIRERFVQTNQLLHSQSINQSELEARNDTLTVELRKQLRVTKRLMRFLEDTEEAATRLRHSRRWKIANPFAWLAASLSKRSVPGFGHLDKVIEAFHRWREKHREVEEIDDALQALTPRAANHPPIGLSPISAGLTNKGVTQSNEPAVPSAPIEFPQHEKVEVSIIVPVFNQCHFTQACLASVQAHQDGIRSEVIVVDDCSQDATPDLFGKIPGLVYLRNESNAGFIVSCNRGAQSARGRYLVFLNNDTVVTPGWLATLRETFDLEARAGLVGSKLVFPDGRLQEAGGIIWRDASGWNRGKFQDADKPEYNFLREVDYCSAACLMIPKSLFESLGGFDTKYAPCYYEDTDLAFKVRATGRKVLYQPFSKVIHFEGATGGTDLATGAKKYQEINRATFAETWATELAEKPVNGDLAAWDALRPEQKRILVIDHHLPMPDRDSGSLRMFQILQIMHQLGHRVTFLPDNLADIVPYGDNLRRRGIEVVHHPYIKSVRQYLEACGSTFDFVILSRCDFAKKHIADVRQHAPQCRLIFDTVDLHFLREERGAQLTQDPELKQIAITKRCLEYELIDQADETWVVSSVEQELLRAERPGKSIEVVSNIVDVPGSTTPFSLRSDILFIGSFQHKPNTDAVLFFTNNIFPLVRKELKAAKFYIIGDKAPPEVIALAQEDVVITGYQPDVSSYFARIRLSVAPLRYGAGVKGKINQSMGFGVPVVATSVAVEGMDLIDRKDIMIADTAEAFAEALVELYHNEDLWERLSHNGLEQTRRLFSFETANRQLRRLLEKENTVALSSERFSSEIEYVDVPRKVAS